jgi:hypothetical protein
MATKKKPEAEPASPVPNREQRRREKFGKAGKVHQHNPLGPWPESEANPALKVVIGDEAADAGGTTEPAATAPAVDGAKPRAKPRAKPKA